ncbi:MAG: hypothetical protein JW760_04695 [Spirochaetales bacterium]|nr:hypothetical protein [Spirochaetales bacterium]
MKLKAIILGILVAVLLTACYPLVSPLQPRTNPSDENSILPVATGFTASYNSNDNVVNLSWITKNPDYQYYRDGYIVIRKAGSPPTNVLDGKYAGLFGPDDDGSGYSDPVDDGSDGDFDEGIEGGCVYYYGLFAYYTEEDDPPAVNNRDDNGNLVDTDYYIFAGPVVADVGVPGMIQLVVQDDRSVDSGNVWSPADEGTLYTGTNASSDPNRLSLIVFNVDPIQDLNIYSASLTIMNMGDLTHQESPTVSRKTTGWSPGDSWAMLTMAGSFSVTEQFLFPTLATGDGDVNTYADESGEVLTSIVQSWAEGEDNFGLMMMYEYISYLDVDNRFQSKESGHGPVLKVYYMAE